MCFWKKKKTNEVGSEKPVEIKDEINVEHLEVKLGGEIFEWFDSPPQIPLIRPPRPDPRKRDVAQDKLNLEDW
jgi:hypothetical protein